MAGRGVYRGAWAAGAGPRKGEAMADLPRLRIVVAEPFSGPRSRLEEFAEVETVSDWTPETLAQAVGDADALIVPARAHVTARILDAGTKLRVVGRVGPSLDHLDVRGAAKRGVKIVYAPEAAVRSQIELTLALILAVHRGLLFLDRRVRDGRLEVLRTLECRELGRTTVGLLGMNRVAAGVAEVVSGTFGCRVLFHDPGGAARNERAAEAVDLETLLKKSDLVSIHLALNESTRGLLSAERLALLRPNARLVNTSRSGVLDGEALAERLKRHELAGAAIDLADNEPLPASHPLRAAPNCLLTAHAGSSAWDPYAAGSEVAEDVIRVLTGMPPKSVAPVPADVEKPATSKE